MFSNRSLALRLTVWYSVAAFLLLLGSTAYLYWALVANLDREDDQFLMERVHTLRALVQQSTNPRDLQREVDSVTATGRLLPIFALILNREGEAVAESPGNPVSPLLPSGETGTEIETADGRAFRVIVQQEAGYVIQVALDRTQEEAMLARYRLNLWAVLGVAMLVCAFGGYQIAKRGIRPVQKITATAREVNAATLDRRIESTGQTTEVAALADTFNAMLDRLEESFARLSRFSADIAHELRTPVNNMRGEMEVALGKARSPDEYREVIGSALEECQRLSRIIDSLLFLARAENPETQICRELFNVGQELRTVVEFYEAAANAARVALTIDSPMSVEARLDRTLFQRAVSNLLANAIAHTPAGGCVTVSAAREEEVLRVEVADTGCGIPKAHLPHVFDRLYRVDGARSAASGGVGLGLAIVKSVAELHGGSVEIASDENRGTRVAMMIRGGEEPETRAQ
jgi:two-component system heavy metal sensor histidine kinase CusS